MKDQILKTSAELFLNLGFKSVTMDDIAQKMGISKKTIYTHFSTKTKLVEATAFHVMETINTGINEIRSQNKNPIVELFEIKRFAMSHLKNEKASPQYQLEKYYPKIYRAIKTNQYVLMGNCIGQNLERGISVGLYRPSIPVDFISKIYFLVGTGIKDTEIFPPEKFAMNDLLGLFLEYHLRAIVTPKGLKTLKEFINIED
jgi:AcrR family transcriptional regulator